MNEAIGLRFKRNMNLVLDEIHFVTPFCAKIGWVFGCIHMFDELGNIHALC